MLMADKVGYRLPDGRMLFSDVSLQVRTGDAIAIEGPSGRGKSTLLGVLSGLLKPTSGAVTLDAPTKAPFAWVLQTLNSLGSRTVLANACLNNVVDGEPPEEAVVRAQARLDQLGIGGLATARARHLSIGELQRLAVARALVSKRPILLADEPSNQLDRTNAVRVMRLLVDAAAEGRAVVIVTHDRDALPGGCRVARLDEDGLHETT